MVEINLFTHFFSSSLSRNWFLTCFQNVTLSVRYLTVMVFLNDVEEGGECAFPVADNATFSWKVNKQKHSSLQNMSNLIRALKQNLTRSGESFSTI